MSTFPEPQLHTDPARGAQVSRDDRAHVFHSWSAQALIDPLPIAGAEGSWFWDLRRQALPRLLAASWSTSTSATSTRSSSPRSRSRPARLCTIAPQLRQRRPQRGGAAHRRPRAGRPRPGVLHQRRRRGHRERHPHGAAAHRAPQGAHRVPQLPRRTPAAITLTGDPRRWPSEPGAAGHRALLGPVPLPLAVPRRPPRRRSASARCSTCDDTIMVEGPARSRRSSSRPSSAPTASSCRRDGYLAGVREICDEHGIVLIADEVMAGFGRCGEWFAVDHWGVDARPDLLRQGRQLRLRAARRRRSSADAIADTFAERAFPGGLTYSGHPLACASAVASIRIFEEEGIVENARAARRRRDRRRASRELASEAPVDRRGARARRLLGARARARPRDPRAAGALQRRRRGRRADERASPRRARPRACGRSSTSTASTSCRRARRRPTRWPRASTSSTARSRSPTGSPPDGSRRRHRQGPRGRRPGARRGAWAPNGATPARRPAARAGRHGDGGGVLPRPAREPVPGRPVVRTHAPAGRTPPGGAW